MVLSGPVSSFDRRRAGCWKGKLWIWWWGGKVLHVFSFLPTTWYTIHCLEWVAGVGECVVPYRRMKRHEVAERMKSRFLEEPGGSAGLLWRCCWGLPWTCWLGSLPKGPSPWPSQGKASVEALLWFRFARKREGVKAWTHLQKKKTPTLSKLQRTTREKISSSWKW